MQAINDALNDAFGQRQISTIYAQANQYRVVLEAMPQYQSDAGRAVAALRARPPAARRCRLSAVAKIERRTAPLAINHQDQFPSVTISFNLAPGASLSDAVSRDRRGQPGDRHALLGDGQLLGRRRRVHQVARRASPG